jgi:hypothetical protein
MLESGAGTGRLFNYIPQSCAQAVYIVRVRLVQTADYAQPYQPDGWREWKNYSFMRRLYKFSTQLFPQQKTNIISVNSSFCTQCTSLINPTTKYINNIKEHA